MILSNVESLIHITEDAVKQFFRGAMDIVNPYAVIKHSVMKHLSTDAGVKDAIDAAGFKDPYAGGKKFARNLGRGTTAGLGLSVADHYYNKIKGESTKDDGSKEDMPRDESPKEQIPQNTPESKQAEEQIMNTPDIKPNSITRTNPLAVAGTGLALGTGAYLLHKKFKNENAKNSDASS